MADALQVVTKPLGNSKFAWRCSVHGTLVEGRSRQPLLGACRAVQRMGADPRQEILLFHEGATEWALRTTVGYGAKWRISDPASGGGPALKPWSTYPVDDDE